MSNDEAISVVQDYIHSLESEILRSKIVRKRGCIKEKRSYFDQRSNAVWAAYETLNYVKNHPKKPPMIAVEDFMKKMDQYACFNSKTSMIFSVGYDIAVDILNALMAMEGN